MGNLDRPARARSSHAPRRSARFGRGGIRPLAPPAKQCDNGVSSP
ncbi:MAG TPA: hypothetical protein VOA78_02900 [Candidatus Dormibacteraeota bacterium]|nr:hypothetical protein [Candidatus Dormibacteraeota bacterium]